MNHIDRIRNEIKRLYETAPDIHVKIKITHPKAAVEGIPAKIVGVYRNVFQIEKSDSGHSNRHTFQYGNVLTGHIVITELMPIASTPNQNDDQG